MTSSSVVLAQLIGTSVTVISITEILNPQIWANNNAAGVYFNGCTLFVGGLAVVQNHNIWQFHWPTLITAVGWGAITLGLCRMIAPEKVLARARKTSRNRLRVEAAGLLPVGIWLIVKGFF
jgi:hypothetical protein